MYLNRLRLTPILSRVHRVRTTRYIQLHREERQVLENFIREKCRKYSFGFSALGGITGVTSYNIIADNKLSPQMKTLSQLGVGTITSFFWPFFLPTSCVFIISMFLNDFKTNDPNQSNQCPL